MSGKHRKPSVTTRKKQALKAGAVTAPVAAVLMLGAATNASADDFSQGGYSQNDQNGGSPNYSQQQGYDQGGNTQEVNQNSGQGTQGDWYSRAQHGSWYNPLYWYTVGNDFMNEHRIGYNSKPPQTEDERDRSLFWDAQMRNLTPGAQAPGKLPTAGLGAGIRGIIEDRTTIPQGSDGTGLTSSQASGSFWSFLAPGDGD